MSDGKSMSNTIMVIYIKYVLIVRAMKQLLLLLLTVTYFWEDGAIEINSLILTSVDVVFLSESWETSNSFMLLFVSEYSNNDHRM